MTNYIGEYRGKAYAVYHLEGNANDDSGNALNGTASNVTFGLAYGKLGQGGSFNGSSSTISLPDSAGFASDWGNVPHTTIAIIKIIATKANTIMCGYTHFNSSNSGGQYFQVNSSNKLYYYNKVIDGSTWAVTGNITLSNNTWYFVAARHDGSYISLFVNGKLDNQVSCNAYGIWNTSWDFVHIGRRQAGNGGDNNFVDYFQGYIDEVAFINKALSDAEIRKYYAWATGKLL